MGCETGEMWGRCGVSRGSRRTHRSRCHFCSSTSTAFGVEGGRVAARFAARAAAASMAVEWPFATVAMTEAVKVSSFGMRATAARSLEREEGGEEWDGDAARPWCV